MSATQKAPHVRQLTNPSEQEIDRATWVLVNSIGAQDLPRAGTGYDSSILHDNFRARIVYGSQDGWIYVVGQEEGGIDGVLCFNPPGWEFGSSKTLGGEIPKFRERVSPDVAEWLKTNLVPWLTSHLKKAFGPAGAKDLFYISLLGIDPALSKKGLGKALLQHVLTLADEQHAEAGLFTQLEENVRWYEKFGFKVTVKEEIDLRESVVPSWGMVRPAQPSLIS